jgi:hypothetical protein
VCAHYSEWHARVCGHPVTKGSWLCISAVDAIGAVYWIIRLRG